MDVESAGWYPNNELYLLKLHTIGIFPEIGQIYLRSRKNAQTTLNTGTCYALPAVQKEEELSLSSKDWASRQKRVEISPFALQRPRIVS